MNRQELKYKLDKLGILPDYYSLFGELLSDRIVLYQNYEKWEVFYFDERGNRNNEKIFRSENDACNYIFDFLREQKEIEDKYN